MADPKSYLTSAVLLTCLGLIALFAGLALPKIQQNKLDAQIQSDNYLTRENARVWGEVPGVRKIAYTKTFNFYNLTATNEQLLAGQVDAVEVKSASYDYNYAYKDLLYAPASNGSVQYHKMFEHVYADGNEDDLRQTFVKTVNIGALKGATQQSQLSTAQLFVQTLYRIYYSFQYNVVPTLVNNYIFSFYVSNKTLTYDTIFLYKNNLTPEQADALWTDGDYGWSSEVTLKAWVDIAAGAVNHTDYQYTLHPNYHVLKNHFGLDDAQMSILVGSSHSKDGYNCTLYLVANLVHSTISALNSCKLSGICNYNELLALQFTNGILTRYPIFPGVQIFDYLSDMNKTYPVPPEIIAVNPKNVSFSLATATNLFMLNDDLSAPYPSPKTLFSIANIEFLLASTEDLDSIVDQFGLENTDQAQILIDYVSYIINSFAYQKDPNLAQYKYPADAISNGMNRMLSDMESLMLVNLTAIGTYKASLKAGTDCAQYLTDIAASTELVSKICDNAGLTLNSAVGQGIWLSAFYGGVGSEAFNNLMSVTGIAQDDLQKMFDPAHQLGGVISTVVKAVSAAAGCATSPCENGHVGLLQWSSSAFTANLPSDYFDGNTYESLADVFPDYFKSFVPEITVSAKRIHSQDITLSFDQAKVVFSFNVGSLNNNYEVLNLISLFEAQDFKGIQDRFGFDQDHAQIIIDYLDDTFINFYLGGLTQTISAYDLLWGYVDPFLNRLSNANFFETMHYFDPKISLFGEKENKATYDKSVQIMINSGTDFPERLRTITFVDGNHTLSCKQTTFDGISRQTSFVSPWNGKSQIINGTDGSGFQSLLKEKEPITVYEDHYLRNIQYNFASTSEVGKKSYAFNTYNLDMSQFSVSEIFNNNWNGFMNLTSINYVPVLVSLPYFTGCEAESYSKVTFDGKSAADYQQAITPGNFTVESLTGTTVSSVKNYQFNAFNSMPYSLTKKLNVAALPLFTVTEKYSTPESNFDADLKGYHDQAGTNRLITILSLVFAFLFAIGAGLMYRAYHVQSKKEQSGTTVNMGSGNYSGLYVDSDAGKDNDSLYHRA